LYCGIPPLVAVVVLVVEALLANGELAEQLLPFFSEFALNAFQTSGSFSVFRRFFQ
jgi:hypothetical protein